ncbi:hypothetical protein A2872_01355 [Candidatus Gottesmanbacteria bacterium RIFCSPHIGHO2_01_FULL_42_12]|uniref:Uncharacterized protein n=1 Tax=Candidatus Gottesmanbacteria bacterium RIFCSPHIGHO2_01_FULL_42_12 TaxID=1798377 RepID=A0A1F5Z4W6_9BACT|nr:MAG: hypothetical protein A2872_01355 [Candidatus Gottesmanbacteria bacterium RIFCSPHIGHO2_01_FULL_42_12]
MTIVYQKKSLIIAGLVSLFLIILGGVIFFTVYKTSRPDETVAPNVPQVKPQAAEPNCTLSFTVTATVTPPPTPVYQCDSECTSDSQCPSGLVCNNNRCRNSNCVDRNDCLCVTTTPTPTPTPTPPPTVVTVTPPPVPKSGWEIPTIVTTLGGAILLLVAKLLL